MKRGIRLVLIVVMLGGAIGSAFAFGVVHGYERTGNEFCHQLGHDYGERRDGVWVCVDRVSNEF